MCIKIVPAYTSIEEVGELFGEYTRMLIEGDATFKDYLEVQHYDQELNQLEAKYGLPYGFYEIICYNNSPMNTSIYMRMKL